MDGVTGIVTKPMEGAKEDGVEGFFKGTLHQIIICTSIALIINSSKPQFSSINVVMGFFLGLGKGVVGVFTRPASGVVDFASSSFEGIRRYDSLPVILFFTLTLDMSQYF